MFLSAYGVGGVVCPMIMAYVVGSQPSYSNYVQGFYVTAGLVVAAMVLSAIMKTPKPPKER
jgi:hypothetical protein